MHKLIALYINEMTKIMKKVSIIVLLSIMLVLVLGSGLLIYASQSITSSVGYRDGSYALDSKDELQMVKSDLENVNAQLANENITPSERAMYEAQKTDYENRIKQLTFAAENGFNLNSSSYRANALNEISAYREQQKTLKEGDPEYTAIQNDINTLEKIIQNKDFNGYIEYSRTKMNSATISADEKKVRLETLDLRLKYKVTGEDKNTNYYENLLSQIENSKLSLISGMTIDQTPLTMESRTRTKESILLNEYKLQHNLPDKSDKDNIKDMGFSVMTNLGTTCILILLILLAGSAVSNEISTGSIKSLIIAPVKRWKIFTAKCLSLLSVGLFSLLLLYFFSILTSGILFGFNTGSPYLFVVNNTPAELNFYLYKFLYMLASFVGILVVAAFALMLSTLTRNTAAAVAISIPTFFVGSTISQLLSFFKGEWKIFIPFNHLNLESRLFPNDEL